MMTTHETTTILQGALHEVNALPGYKFGVKAITRIVEKHYMIAYQAQIERASHPIKDEGGS